MGLVEIKGHVHDITMETEFPFSSYKEIVESMRHKLSPEVTVPKTSIIGIYRLIWK